MPRSFLKLPILLLVACGGGRMTVPVSNEPAPMPSVAVAVTDARGGRTVVATRAGASALVLLSGSVAVADSSGVAALHAGAFSPVPVGAPGESTPLGAVRFAARRETGVLLVAEGGLFDDAAGRLLRAPISTTLSMDGVRFVDAVGSGADETWWLTTSSGALRVSGGEVQGVEVADPHEPGELQAVVALTPTTALLVRGATLYRLDVSATPPVATALARGLGTVTTFDRTSDGAALLATDSGLVRVAADATVAKLTFGPSDSVSEVVAVGPVSLVAAGGALLELSGDTARTLADLATPHVRGAVRDTSGATSFLDGDQLISLTAPAAVSFARDVKPFFDAHCTSCHATGAQYSPVINFDDYATAKTNAARAVVRLESAASPMPPVSTEVLTAAQYAVVVQWVQGGLKP